MGFVLPSGVVNTDSVYFYADTTLMFGPLVKEPSDQTLVVIDYSQLGPIFTIVGFDFAVDVSSNPQLVVAYPQVDSTGAVLSFLLSGGIAGQQYNLSITTPNRTDVLTINIPSAGDCDCATINPVPWLYTQLPLGEPTQGYVNSGVRYFWGAAPPTNPNVMDQWFDTTSQTILEWVTDGLTFLWRPFAAEENYIGEAPTDGRLYGRENTTWQLVPIFPEAPSDGTLYGRQNGAWLAAYPAGNPNNYQTAAQVTAALVPFALLSGARPFTGAVQFNAGLLLPNGPATLAISGGTVGQILVANASGALAWANPPSGGGASVTIAATAPASPTVGALWWDSAGGQMYILYDDGTSQQWVPVVNEVGAYLSMAGGTVTGPIDLKNQAVTQAGAVLTINRAVAENVSVSVTANITSVVVNGWPIAGTTGKLRLIINNTGAFTVAGWPTGTIWPGGTAPVITSGAGKKDIVLLMSDDGGVTIFGSIVGQDYH
jgi:hypothetical protein